MTTLGLGGPGQGVQSQRAKPSWGFYTGRKSKPRWGRRLKEGGNDCNVSTQRQSDGEASPSPPLPPSSDLCAQTKQLVRTLALTIASRGVGGRQISERVWDEGVIEHKGPPCVPPKTVQFFRGVNIMWAEGIKGAIWGCTEKRHLGNPKPFPSLSSSRHQPGLLRKAGAAQNWPHARLPGRWGGDEKGAPGSG